MLIDCNSSKRYLKPLLSDSEDTFGLDKFVIFYLCHYSEVSLESSFSNNYPECLTLFITVYSLGTDKSKSRLLPLKGNVFHLSPIIGLLCPISFGKFEIKNIQIGIIIFPLSLDFQGKPESLHSKFQSPPSNIIDRRN